MPAVSYIQHLDSSNHFTFINSIDVVAVQDPASIVHSIAKKPLVVPWISISCIGSNIKQPSQLPVHSALRLCPLLAIILCFRETWAGSIKTRSAFDHKQLEERAQRNRDEERPYESVGRFHGQHSSVSWSCPIFHYSAFTSPSFGGRCIEIHLW